MDDAAPSACPVSWRSFARPVLYNPNSLERARIVSGKIGRPARIGRSLDYCPIPAFSSAQARFDTAHLLEEIYYWHPGQEDLWTCLEGSSTVERIRKNLVERFDPSVSPGERYIPQFKSAIDDVRELLSKSSRWGDAVQTVRTRRDDADNLRANGPLSLLLHFDWIVRTFGSVPRASVAIR